MLKKQTTQPRRKRLLARGRHGRFLRSDRRVLLERLLIKARADGGSPGATRVAKDLDTSLYMIRQAFREATPFEKEELLAWFGPRFGKRGGHKPPRLTDQQITEALLGEYENAESWLGFGPEGRRYHCDARRLRKIVEGEPTGRLFAWATRQPPRGGKPPPLSREQIQGALLKKARARERFPGLTPLEKRLHTSVRRLRCIILSNHELLEWAHGLPGNGPRRIPRVDRNSIRDDLLVRAERQDRFRGVRALSRELGHSVELITEIIEQSPRLRRWAGPALHKRGGRAPRFTAEEMTTKLLRKVHNRITFEGIRPLQLELKSAPKRIREVIERNEVLQKWAGERLGQRGNPRPPTKTRRVQASLRAMRASKKRYPGDRASGRQCRCTKETVKRAIELDETGDLLRWRLGEGITDGEARNSELPPRADAPEAAPERAQHGSPPADRLTGLPGFLGATGIADCFHVPKNKRNVLHVRLCRFRIKYGHDRKYVVEVETPGPHEPHYLHSLKHVYPLIKDLCKPPDAP